MKRSSGFERDCLETTVAVLFLLNLGLLANLTEAAGIKDSESATHGSEDAFHQIVDTYKFPGFEIVQFNLPVLSHYSYLLVSGKEALAVDPDRDINAYLDHAKKHGLTIKGVFLTHSHADFVAGHLELVRSLKVPIYQNAASGAKYKIEALQEGSSFKVGVATVKVMETPGHTPDGMCGLVFSEGDAQPKAVFTGDTLFVGSIGRPDLLEGKMTAATLASMSFDTWHNKLSKLPDTVLVLPAHGAGSLCGAHLSDDPASTIGKERSSNPYLQHKGRSEFISAVLEGLPEAPQYFKHNAAMNREGPPLVSWDAAPVQAKVDESITRVEEQWLVDLRDAKPYADGHVPGSINIGLRGRLESWVGIMVPWKAPMVLIGSPAEIKEAVFRLHRVVYTGSVLPFEVWTKAGLPLAKSGTIKPGELYAQMQDGSAPIIVDVRMPSEWMALRIGTVVNLPINHLGELSGKLDPSLPVVAVCNSAYRSSLAVGILQRKGFKQVSSLEGGSAAWIEAGYPVFGSEQKATVSAAPKRQVHLAERISPADLNRLMKDMPGTFDLVDIRPPEAFQDYALPGSTNADLADVLSNAAYHTGAGPLIIVDRDGSLAMMVAGILSQKTKRPIKALHGGLDGFWEETELKSAVRMDPEHFRGVIGGVSSMLLPADMIARHLGLLGIRPETTVIIVPSEKLQDATLVGIALERVGHWRYAILNGGWEKWQVEQLPVDTRLPAFTAMDYPVPRQADAFTVDHLTVLEHSQRRSAVILDVRPADFYSGVKSDEARAGHIPSAVNRPFSADPATRDGVTSFKPVAEIEEAYARLIPSKDSTVVVTCRTGHQASQTRFVLQHLLGYRNVLWYDGGWAEWASRPELPVETTR